MIEKSQRILLVDDDEVDRIAIRRALKKSTTALDVVEASGFLEATAYLREQSFDCLLMDYRLGGQEGIELIKAIHNDNLSDAPIVMLSGLEDESAMLSCLKEGAQDFLLKSEITTSSLLRSIRYAEERKTIAIEMRYLAQHDQLTGLANRALFVESVKRAVMRSRRSGGFFGIIFIDLDNFKSVNDTLGHEAGDELLVAIAERIRDVFRQEDVVGRLGGDEFAVLIEGVAKESSLIKVAQKLLSATREPISLYGRTLYATVSLGIATYPTCAQEASSLIKCADLAMYQAKQAGRNDYYFYSKGLQTLAEDYANLKIDIRNALANEEFELYYQPQIDAQSGDITGVEALIRWHHPSRGMVAPDQFIPIAESLGLINDIGDWVVREACRQLNVWLSAYPSLQSRFTMAVNVSAHQIRQLNLKEKVCQAVDENSLPYGLIELELTESALIDDLGRSTEKLDSLHGLGFQLAIDDFGTGFASFRHLQQLPLKVLKIDKSFIDQICSTQKSYEIVKAMIVMAHALGMSVTAEGVEDEAQADLLRQLSCDKLQGYYFSKPQPAKVIDQLLLKQGSIAQSTGSGSSAEK